jgi:hypothetical protein
VKGELDMSTLDEHQRNYFVDFDSRFKARLSAVIPTRTPEGAIGKTLGASARYACEIKVEYHRDLMRLVEEGMLLATRNFKSMPGSEGRFTLTEISRIHPEHYGLRGLSDQSYYPMQFEIIQQSVSDWDSNDKSTMMIQITSIPINYDLIIKPDQQPEYVRGFSYPIVAEHAYLLNKDMINRMYNKRILDKLAGNSKKLESKSDARESPRLGTIKMFEASTEKIPIFVDFENLVRYHFGIFSFTGGGKSNLVSNIVRRLIYHAKNTKIVIFDISCEYPFLLMDVFADSKVDSKIVLEAPIQKPEQLFTSVVKPRDFEVDAKVEHVFDTICSQNKIFHYTRPRFKIPTYTQFMSEISEQAGEITGKATYKDALESIRQAVFDYQRLKGLDDSHQIDEDFVKYIDEKGKDAVEKFKVSEKSNVYGWATTRSSLIETIQRAREIDGKQKRGLTTEKIIELVEGSAQLTCLSIADQFIIKELAVDLSREFLRKRKKKFKVEPLVLFVFDEAQEFAPALGDARGIDRDCSEAVEVLLRQGRKYGLGGCLATQRIAYLNTNALQQLHTYFVGTLPRPYDRNLVSETFTIDQSILEKTLEFAPGEWLLSSYIATGMENVPIFIKADNAEEEIKKTLPINL